MSNLKSGGRATFHYVVQMPFTCEGHTACFKDLKSRASRPPESSLTRLKSEVLKQTDNIFNLYLKRGVGWWGSSTSGLQVTHIITVNLHLTGKARLTFNFIGSITAPLHAMLVPYAT